MALGMESPLIYNRDHAKPSSGAETPGRTRGSKHAMMVVCAESLSFRADLLADSLQLVRSLGASPRK